MDELGASQSRSSRESPSVMPTRQDCPLAKPGKEASRFDKDPASTGLGLVMPLGPAPADARIRQTLPPAPITGQRAAKSKSARSCRAIPRPDRKVLAPRASTKPRSWHASGHRDMKSGARRQDAR